MSETPKTTREAALGALLGALVGDAAGATLEFLDHVPSREEVDRALTMPGGGCWHVAPGQITDDGELTIALALGLAESPCFDRERVARRYADWIESAPFDIGGTTLNSLGSFERGRWAGVARERGYAAAMSGAARELCMGSKANGSLMRATPLGVWGHRLRDEELAWYAEQDSGLSHPNPSCVDAVTAYVLAVAHLVLRPGDTAGAFARARAWVEAEAEAEVRVWLSEAEANVAPAYSPMAGFARIAFTHAFRHLRLGSGYEEAIRETLRGGGDTDTNACIVGGLVGAARGVDGIPRPMLEAVLGCDSRQGRPRPDWLSASRATELVDRLLASAPGT